MNKRKSAKTDPNYDFCEFLLELGEYEKNVTRNIHKYNAYRKAAAALAEHKTRIKSGDEAKQLNGVGEKIAKKIDEYLATGKLQKLENIHLDPKSTAISLLTRVTGIGPAKAHSLVEEGITTIEDLKKHTDKLTHHQIIGLRYFQDFETKIPRKEVEEIEKIIVHTLKKKDPDFKITICGSYRRGKPESGDIDTLITHPSLKSDLTDHKNKKHQNHMLKDIIKVLEDCKLVTETLSLGETKFMGVCRLHHDKPARRLDIRLVPQDHYYCSILYFTGSDVFNQNMRAHALENGFTLNEYSLRPVGQTGIPGEPVEINSEEDIFECIDYPYKIPEERNK